MKHILLTLLVAFSLQPLAISADVTIVSATVVTVDGVNAGKPADTIRNRPELASAIQRAIEARELKQAAALSSLQSKLDASNAAFAAMVEKLRAAGTNATALAAVRAEAIKPEVDKKRAALLAEMAKKQAELDALK